MSCRFHCYRLAVLICFTLLMHSALLAATQSRPNVVLIMTDNQGAWTLGCYGNADIRTPHIDRLATEGILFTRAFASNPVCSPTRATFLTGLIPSQHGVHSYLHDGRLQVGPEARNTLAELTSLPEILHDAGYRCGLIGKWHLGDNLNPQEGFEDYWITMPRGGTGEFYDAQIIENGKIRKEPEYLTDFWTRHAVKFIEQSSEGDRPFFLFLAYNGPYSLGGLLMREGRNRHAAYYADKQLSSFPREETHPWQYDNRDYINNPVSIRRVATEVSGIDDGVGRVMAALKKHGIDDNTLVIFVADQGWVGGHGGFWGMGDHTRPFTAFDGMMRIPMIWRQPPVIAASQRSELMVSNYDFMPTLLGYLGLVDLTPTKPKSPGRDFSAVLKGEQVTNWNNEVFYEYEYTRAVRTERWKYVHRHPNGPHELYDLSADPSEQNNLITNRGSASVRQSLKQRLDRFFEQYAEPKYDLWRGGGSQTVLHKRIDKKIAPPKPIEPPPLPDDFELPELKVPVGYTVELVAGPPLVEHPMMASFDDRGRLFVADSAGLNLDKNELEQQLPNFVRMLEDRDEDGRFDRSTIFADKLTFPQGALWHDGALYVASPPNIWLLKDTDDNGTADQREILVSKFGYTGNAAGIHGPFFGPNGRIYWCDGRHGHEIRNSDGQIVSKGEGSYIFSCHPDGSDVRAHCGGGMDNPVEVDFRDEGELLGTVNLMYAQPRNDCLVHWLYGGVYPHDERVLGEFKRTGELLGAVYKFGHVAVSGMTRYRSGVLDRNFRDNIFVTTFNAGKVLRVELTRAGATFQAVPHEFLNCASDSFHLTDVLEDADGSLLVIDTGGWFRIGCPTSQIAKPDIKGGIYRIRRRGATPLVDPRGKRIEWTGLSDSQLVELLMDTRWAVRERAIAECSKRSASIVATLRGVLSGLNSRQRRNAVWALTRIGTEQAKAAVRSALDDSSQSVRQAACNSIATTVDAQAVPKLALLLQHDSPPVRRVAATALGRIGNSDCVPDLLKALNRQIDRAEEHALIYALIETNDPSATLQGLTSASASTRRGALIALDQLDDDKLTAEIVGSALLSDDKALQQSALNIFSRRSQWADHAARMLEKWLSDGTNVVHQQHLIREMVAAFMADERIGLLVAEKLSHKNTTPATRELLLAAISDGDSLPMHESLVAPLQELLASEDRQILEAAIAAAASFDTDRFNDRLRSIAADNEQPVLVRVAALAAVAGHSDLLSEPAFELLLGLLAEHAVPLQRLRAAQMIGAANLSRQQQLALVPQLATAGPLELRELIKPYKDNSDAEIGRKLLASVEQSPSFWSLLPAELWNTVQDCPPETANLAMPLVEKLRSQEEQKQDRLALLSPLVRQGDATRGRAVFASAKVNCVACHRIGQEGGQIGPDLTHIGSIRSGRDLLEAIVFPSSTFVRGYQPYLIITIDGRVESGNIVRETEDMIYVQTQVGSPIAIPKNSIDEIAPSTVSIMPQGFDRILSQQEVADLVSYLASLK